MSRRNIDRVPVCWTAECSSQLDEAFETRATPTPRRLPAQLANDETMLGIPNNAEKSGRRRSEHCRQIIRHLRRLPEGVLHHFRPQDVHNRKTVRSMNCQMVRHRIELPSEPRPE